MVTKATILVNGNLVDAPELNGIIEQPLDIDNTNKTTTSATYANVRTLSIDANTVKDHIIVRANLRGTHGGTDVSGTASAQITVNGTQRLEVVTETVTFNVKSSFPVTSDNYQPGGGGHRVLTLKYSPTAGEKTAVITLNLDMKITNASGSTITARNDYWEVYAA